MVLMIVYSNFSQYPALLHEFARKKQWEQAIKLCRYAKVIYIKSSILFIKL